MGTNRSLDSLRFYWQHVGGLKGDFELNKQHNATVRYSIIWFAKIFNFLQEWWVISTHSYIQYRNISFWHFDEILGKAGLFTWPNAIACVVIYICTQLSCWPYSVKSQTHSKILQFPSYQYACSWPNIPLRQSWQKSASECEQVHWSAVSLLMHFRHLKATWKHCAIDQIGKLRVHIDNDSILKTHLSFTCITTEVSVQHSHQYHCSISWSS